MGGAGGKQAFLNTGFSYIGLALGFLNALILQPWFLTTDQIGSLKFLYSTASILSILVPVGLTGVVIKFLPAHRKNKKSRTAFLTFVLTICALYNLGFILLVEGVFSDSLVEKIFGTDVNHKLLILFSVVVSFVNVLSSFLLGIQRSVVVVVWNDVIARLLLIIELFLFHETLINFEYLLWLYVLNYLLILLVFLSSTRTSLRLNFALFRPDGVFTPEDRKTMLKFSYFIAVIAIANVALKNIDSVILGRVSGAYLLGMYSISLVIAGLSEVPATALSKVYDTQISACLHENNSKELAKIYSESTRLLFIGGIGIVGFIWIFIPELLGLLPGNFTACVWPIRILLIGSLSNLVTGLNSILVFYDRKSNAGLYLMVITFILQIALLFLFIEYFGLLGACIATSLVGTFFNFSKTFLIKKNYNLWPYNWYYFSILGLLALVFFLSSIGTGLILKGILFLFFLFALLYYLRRSGGLGFNVYGIRL